MQQELYYKDALKLGQKEYRARLAKKEDPYLPVLDNIVPPEKGLQTIHLGITQIPVFFILGTKTAGRTNAFAANLLKSGRCFTARISARASATRSRSMNTCTAITFRRATSA